MKEKAKFYAASAGFAIVILIYIVIFESMLVRVTGSEVNIVAITAIVLGAAILIAGIEICRYLINRFRKR